MPLALDERTHPVEFATPPVDVGDDGIVAQLLVEIRFDGIVRNAVRASKTDVERRLEKRDSERLRATVIGAGDLFREIDDARALGLGTVAADGNVLRDDAVLRIWRKVGICPTSMAKPHHAIAVLRTVNH